MTVAKCANCSNESADGVKTCRYCRAYANWKLRELTARRTGRTFTDPKPQRSDFRDQRYTGPHGNRIAPPVATEPARPAPLSVPALRASHARARATLEEDEPALEPPTPCLPIPPSFPARAPSAPVDLPPWVAEGFRFDDDAPDVRPWAMQHLVTAQGESFLAVYDEKGRAIDVIAVRDAQIPRWARGLALLPAVMVVSVQASIVRRRARGVA